jgi:CRISPR-associated protein Cas6
MSFEDDLPPASVVDLVFPLTGRSLPRDYTQALHAALQQELPWLAQEPRAGVHPLKLVQGSTAGPVSLLSPRTRLLLRLPRERVAQASALAGRTLAVEGHTMQLAAPHERELLPHATLYAYAVAAAGEDEAAFMQAVAGELQALGVRTQTVCGKRGERPYDSRTLTTFSLMLHALSAADSLRVQERGLGPHRLLGCGVFVPHKSAAAVGE